MGYKYRDLGRVLADGMGDLLGCQHQAPRRVQQNIDGHIRRCQADSSQHLLRIFNAYVPGYWNVKKTDSLLTMYNGDKPGTPFYFKLADPLYAA